MPKDKDFRHPPRWIAENNSVHLLYHLTFSFSITKRVNISYSLTYALNTEDIATIGVKATFVTSKNTDANIVYAITKEVFENFEDFKSLHPSYSILTKQDMLKGLSSPIHKGALRYYREAGLEKFIDTKLITD